jgi:hypothetical protein
MRKSILSCVLIIVAIACKDDTEGLGIHTFNALTDITNAAPLVDGEEKYNMIVQYSTDEGATFVDWPAVKKGDQYWAKVVVRDGGDVELKTTKCYALDWSGSTPAPDNVNGNLAQFTMQKDNALLGKVTYTNYTPFDRSFWLGDFTGDEHGKCCEGGHDDNTFREDPSNQNAIIMDNFWGDGVDAQIIFTSSTNADTQVVTIPAQTTSEGGSIAASTGTYDQCTQTMTFAAIPYTIGGKTYTFGYDIHR